MDHVCAPPEPHRAFCVCGKLVKRENLVGVTLRFAGWCSPNPQLDDFWSTGDPTVFNRGKSGTVC